MKESPVFGRTHDLLQWLLRVTEHFPRGQRFVLARRVQDTAFDLQEALLEAGITSGPGRAPALQRADVQLAKLRYYLRLSREMDWLGVGQYEHASVMLDEIGRFTGGWRRKERESSPGA